jgi:hypothetical protein
MNRFLIWQLPVLTLLMSVPLFFSFHLISPSERFRGVPFVVLWSWGVLSAVTLPVLLVVEIVCCSWWLFRQSTGHIDLWRHAFAILVALVAEVVFIAARMMAV